MKIYGIVLNNFSDGMMCGSPVPRGCLNLIVNAMPKLIYQRSGNTIWSEKDGVVNCFTYNPHDRQGFAGRKITLPMIKEGNVFKNKGVSMVNFHGSLWDTGKAYNETSEILGQKIHSIGIKEQNSKFDLFSSCYVTDELMKKISQHVILGDPVQKRDFKNGF